MAVAAMLAERRPSAGAASVTAGVSAGLVAVVDADVGAGIGAGIGANQGGSAEAMSWRPPAWRVGTLAGSRVRSSPGCADAAQFGIEHGNRQPAPPRGRRAGSWRRPPSRGAAARPAEPAGLRACWSGRRAACAPQSCATPSHQPCAGAAAAAPTAAWAAPATIHLPHLNAPTRFPLRDRPRHRDHRRLHLPGNIPQATRYDLQAKLASSTARRRGTEVTAV